MNYPRNKVIPTAADALWISTAYVGLVLRN